MRLLTVNYALPNPEIDNHSVFNAPPLFDYPAVLVDPNGLSRAIEDVLTGGQHTTASGLAVRDEISSPIAVALAEALQRRREETIRLLRRGGLVIAFAFPNVLHPRVTGFTGCDRYFWLPAPPGLAYREPFLVGADGGGSRVVHDTHPLGRVLEQHERAAGYRAYFDEERPGFDEFGTVIARSPGGAATAIELRVLGGRIVFLPAVESLRSGQPRFDLARDLLQAARTLVRATGAVPAPHWVENYLLPGIEEGRRALERAGLAAEQAVAARDEVTERLEELERYRGLLWQEGFPLEEGARDAMRRLGFSVSGGPGDPARLSADGVEAAMETEGSEAEVGDESFRRLSRRIEDELLAGGVGMKGLLVLNGFRLQDPAGRVRGYEERLVRAAEFQGFALVTGPQLFRLLERGMTGRDDPRVLRALLLHTEGELTLPEDAAVAGATQS